MAETKVKRPISIVQPFGIEADHPRNCNLLIQAIPGCRLRSAISGAKPAKNARTGEKRIPVDQARHLGQFPPIPGMQLHVNPRDCTYTVLDPLAEDEELCEKIRRTIDRTMPFKVGNKLKGVKTQKGKLDPHRMKTLCRECIWLLEAGEAKLVKGPLPDISDVEELPGNFLLNPGSVVGNTQPIFEKDWDEWFEKLVRSAG